MTKYIQIITTTATKKDAENIANILINKRVAACAQIKGPIESIYWWNDKIDKTEEWQCIIKTKKCLYRKIEEQILNIHTYEVPEIIAIPIVSGYNKYLKWIDKETI